MAARIEEAHADWRLPEGGVPPLSNLGEWKHLEMPLCTFEEDPDLWYRYALQCFGEYFLRAVWYHMVL